MPAFQPRVKREKGTLYIFDTLRRQFVVLTPEEWVRQHIVNYLIEHKGYPKMLIAVEQEIDLNGLRRRFDIVCYRRDTTPYLLIECKAPTVPITQKVYDQAFNYNHIIKAPFVAMSNGCQHHCYRCTEMGFTRLPDFPEFA
ncbi:MAG: type I restriction enzyme HsdR N-terminal domain-containing protein [Marinifilaceae bacterium]